MVILAADTSTGLASVAVRDPGGKIVLVRADGKRPHSETLLPSFEEALSLAGLGRGDVRALAVGTGPGIFTGLRVGLATVKGWALASGLPLLPVPSHEAAAFSSLKEGKKVLVLTDARKGEVFASAFCGLEEDGLPERSGDTLLLPLGKVRAWAAPYLSDGPVVFGTAVPLLGEGEGDKWSGRASVFKEEPLAAGVLAIGEVLMSLGRSVGPAFLVPEYVRPPDARPQGSMGPVGDP